jgi:murein DD-endopeptidase MepM/ murein hydrolase activator NlpD
MMYERLLADGEVFKTGKILNAEFINRGKSYQAVWFSDASSAKGDYYSMDGLNLRRTFLASPLAFSRVTSGFSMRLHPILQTWKAHLGVDYAAPTGTPVRAVGNGVVESAGAQNGFGNVVFIKHPQGPLTVYAHLSHIGVRKGQSVSQGDIIGGVGMTGWATGPHLHFEFRLNGLHQDPMTLAKQNTPVPLANEFRPQFFKQAQLAKSTLSGLSESALETVDID